MKFNELTQFTVPVPNTPGQLHRITELLGSKGYNITMITSHVVGDVAFVQLTTPVEQSKIVDLLRTINITPIQTPVVGLMVPNQPNTLTNLLKYLQENKVNVNNIVGTTPVDAETSFIVLSLEGATAGILPTKQLLEKFVESITPVAVAA